MGDSVTKMSFCVSSDQLGVAVSCWLVMARQELVFVNSHRAVGLLGIAPVSNSGVAVLGHLLHAVCCMGVPVIPVN